jgi:2-polyprenyl-3-methyl-5-hydroxy-6-metoxy-1,4-benzoquinol methylase
MSLDRSELTSMSDLNIADKRRFERLNFNLRGISDLRGYEADGLEEGYCELDPQCLVTMREVYGSDQQAQAMVDLYERRLVFGRAPNRPRLHAEVLASTLALVRMSRPESVLDLGCGVGLLTRALVREPYIKRVVGADIDTRHVKVAKALLPKESLAHKPTIEMRHLNVEAATDSNLVQGIEFIALNEVVQQIEDKDWISNVFALKPNMLVVTTPNKDFNAIYPSILLCENGLRDPEHAFEFTQAAFITWAHTYARRFNYSVDILPLGPADATHGSASLMAVFQKTPDMTGSLLAIARNADTSRIVQTALNPLQYDSSDVHWETEGSLHSPNRRLFLEYLRPPLSEVAGKRVIDIGCGQGWLSTEVIRSGGRPLGIDPSVRCLSTARFLNPDLELRQESLQSFHTIERFDTAFMIMVENFLEVRTIFTKVRQLLQPGGQFILIVADFERSIKGLDHKVEYEVVSEDAVALRVECPDRFGVLCDIHHPLASYIQVAGDTGFNSYQHTNIMPRSWHPRYAAYKGKPLFHLLEFTKN